MSDKEIDNTAKEQMECVKSTVVEESDHNAAAAFAISPSNDQNTANNIVVTGEQETEAAFPEAEHEVDVDSIQNKHVDVCPPQTQTLVSKEVEAVSSTAETSASTKEKEFEEKTLIELKEYNKYEEEETKVNVLHHERLMRHLRRYREQQQQESFINKEHVKPQPSSSKSAMQEQHAEELSETSSSSSLSSSSASSSSEELEEQEEEELTKEKAEQEPRRGHVQSTRLATRLSRSVSIRNRQHKLPSHSKNNRGLPSIVSLHPSHQRHQAFHINLRRERYDQHQHQHQHERQRERQRRAKKRGSNVLHESQPHQSTMLELEQNESSEHKYNKPDQEQTSSESNSVQSDDHVIASDIVNVHDRKDVNRKHQNRFLRRRRDRHKQIKHHVLPSLHHAIVPSHYNTTESDDEQVRRVRRGKRIHADNSVSDDSRAYSLDEGEVQLRVHEMHQEREAEIEESVWREMQEIEQATQQWERMIGAMHTNTILQTEQASESSKSVNSTSKAQERHVKHFSHSHHHHHKHHYHRGETKEEQFSGDDDDNNIVSRDRHKSNKSKLDESTSHASHSYQSSVRKATITHNTVDKLNNKNDGDSISENISNKRSKKRHHGKRSSATHKNSIRSSSSSNNSSSKKTTNKQSRGSSTNRSSSSGSSSSSTDTDKRSSRPAFQRMNFGVLQDPRNAIINMILSSTSGSIDIHDIHERFHWEDEYEHVYGSVAEYLQSYQAIFVTSPIDDRVTLRRARVASQIAERLRKDDDEMEETFYSHRALMARAKKSLSLMKSSEEDELVATAASSNPEIHTKQSVHTKERNNNDTIYNKRNISRRTTNRSVQHTSAIRASSSRGRSVRRRPLTSGSALLPWSNLTLTAAAAHIGSISYSCVAEEFALEELETIYRRRGYEVNEFCDALHIHATCKFDLFLFSNGVVVW